MSTTKPDNNVSGGVSGIEFIELGRIDYETAFDIQRRIHAEVLAGERQPVVLLLEHEPVITVSKRDTAMGHLLADETQLRREGVEVCRTDRGGDITYHGPGQLVAYPILPLQRFGLNLRQYVHLLEQAVIETAGAYGVEAHRDACAIGVWVGGDASQNEAADGGSGCAAGSGADADEGASACAASGSAGTGGDDERLAGGAKLAAVGVRVRRWVSMHGLALNVTTNLEHFGLIVPCGLERPVTSLAKELGSRCPGVGEVSETLAGSLRRLLLRD